MFQFKIQLKEIQKPSVWRRVLVPETFTFYQFHEVIQVAFEWFDEHLFLFSPQGYGSHPVIALPSEDNPESPIDATQIMLNEVFKEKGQTYTYIYDFGDDWTHEITLEEITDGQVPYASCLAGKGACPPEDCGGVFAYERIKEVFANSPDSEEADQLRDWLGLEEGEVWDVNEFYLEDVNEELEGM